MPVFQASSSDFSDTPNPESQADRSRIEGLQRIADGIATLLCELRPEFGHLQSEAQTIGFLRTGADTWKGLSEPGALSLEDALAQLAAKGAAERTLDAS